VESGEIGLKVTDCKEPKVWQRSSELTKEIYMITKRFPEDEKYGLTSQIRRAAVSVPSNIAEGANSGSTKEFIRFLYIAIGSSAELETQLLLVEEIGLLNKSIDESIENSKKSLKCCMA